MRTAGFGAGMGPADAHRAAAGLRHAPSSCSGPLSDRFGRRPVLLWGLAAYVLAAIGSALAASIELLIVWRAVQGAAMGAAVMCARAIVRDLYLPADGARVMSRALTGLGVIACLCAPLGGLVSDLFGWRTALMVLARVRRRHAGAGGAALQRDAGASQARCPAHSAACFRPGPWCCATPPSCRSPRSPRRPMACCSPFWRASSFVFIQVLGLTKTQYGLVMLWGSLVYIAGTFLCRYWLARHGVRGSVARGAVLTLAGGTIVGVLALAGVHAVWAIVAPLTLSMLAHGIHQPCGQTGAVGPFPQAAGAASALNGFVMMLAAFGIGGWLGVRMDGTVLPLALGIWFWSACIALVAWTLVQKLWRRRTGWVGIAGARPPSGKTAAALAIARAHAGRDRQRRFGAGLPRHGHRHRQAQRRRNARRCRTT